MEQVTSKKNNSVKNRTSGQPEVHSVKKKEKKAVRSETGTQSKESGKCLHILGR